MNELVHIIDRDIYGVIQSTSTYPWSLVTVWTSEGLVATFPANLEIVNIDSEEKEE